MEVTITIKITKESRDMLRFIAALTGEKHHRVIQRLLEVEKDRILGFEGITTISKDVEKIRDKHFIVMEQLRDVMKQITIADEGKEADLITEYRKLKKEEIEIAKQLGNII